MTEEPSAQQIIVFIAVPSKFAGRYDFWSNVPNSSRPGVVGWHRVLNSSTVPEALATHLSDSCRWRGGTEYAVAVLEASPAGFWDCLGLRGSGAPYRYGAQHKAAAVIRDFRAANVVPCPASSAAPAPATQPTVLWNTVYVHCERTMWRLTEDATGRELMTTWGKMGFAEARTRFNSAMLVEAKLRDGYVLQSYHGPLELFPGLGDVVQKIFGQDSSETLAPLAPAEEKKAEPERCSFCENPAVVLAPNGLRTCMVHPEALGYHAERLALGGLNDSPETRAESVRFAQAEYARKDLEDAQLCGFRTKMDLVPLALTVTSLTHPKPAPPEEVPLVGTTPHYEWP